MKEGRTIPVPIHLRDTHYQGSKRLGHGQAYKYAHDFPEGFVEQDYLGVDKTYYEPTNRGYEAEIAERLARFKARRNEQLRAKPDSADANDDDTDVSDHQ